MLLLSVGGEVRGAFEAVLRQLSMAPVVMQATALGIGEERVATFLLPVKASSHPSVQSRSGLFGLLEQSFLLYPFPGHYPADNGLCYWW